MNSPKKKILVVDRKPKNAELLSEFLKDKGFTCYSAGNYPEMDRVLKGHQTLNAVIMDVAGFDENIWERCKKIQQTNIPFLILSKNPKGRLMEESMKYGARAVLGKPLIMKEFFNLLKSLTSDETG